VIVLSGTVNPSSMNLTQFRVGTYANDLARTIPGTRDIPAGE